MGKEDVQAMFDDYVKDCKDRGIEKVIEEVNAKAKEVGLN
jgi:hypothetical protein